MTLQERAYTSPIWYTPEKKGGYKMRKNFVFVVAAFALMIAGSLALPVFAQEQNAAERVIALKTNLEQSQNALRQYEWVETTVVSLKGEEKSRKQSACYYGADGKVTKVLLTPPAPESKKHGLRGKIAEEKKEELTDYMKEAVNLVHQYVPPAPSRVLAGKDAGKVSIQLIEPGKRVRLTFADYLKNGDNLAVDVDPTSNRLLALNVKSYLDSDKEPVTLAVTFSALNDGTTYASQTVLDAKGKNLQVTSQNSGYLKKAQ
jgi:hypothetical protein